MNQLTDTTTLRRSDWIRETDNQDGAVLMDIRKGQCFTMNPVAVLIWKQLVAGCTPASIAEYLARKFEISCDQAFSDIQEFVLQLEANEFLIQEQSDEGTGSDGLEWLKGLPKKLWDQIWGLGPARER